MLSDGGRQWQQCYTKCKGMVQSRKKHNKDSVGCVILLGNMASVTLSVAGALI